VIASSVARVSISRRARAEARPSRDPTDERQISRAARQRE